MRIEYFKINHRTTSDESLTPAPAEISSDDSDSLDNLASIYEACANPARKASATTIIDYISKSEKDLDSVLQKIIDTSASTKIYLRCFLGDELSHSKAITAAQNLRLAKSVKKIDGRIDMILSEIKSSILSSDALAELIAFFELRERLYLLKATDCNDHDDICDLFFNCFKSWKSEQSTVRIGLSHEEVIRQQKKKILSAIFSSESLNSSWKIIEEISNLFKIDSLKSEDDIDCGYFRSNSSKI